jgi:pyridoxine 5-phosphate synthase
MSGTKTKLSVNINKFATLRNSRGGNRPDVIQAAMDCETFGAQGITVHPRPDERHIRYADVFELSKVVRTEFNIEGNPKQGRFLEICKTLRPTQATLVPDDVNALTSNKGWDTITHRAYLREVIAELKSLSIRTSIFVDPMPEMIAGAAETGTDRIELYTEDYAKNYRNDREKAIAPYVIAAEAATKFGIGINAGHDLDLENLRYLKSCIPDLLEVSIGHALVCDALYYGLQNVIQMYLRELS